MRLLALAVCALVVNAAFVAMLLANVKAVRTRAAPEALRRSVAKELFWAAIPWLILVAAATPAVRSLVAAPGAARPLQRLRRPGATPIQVKAVPSSWRESGRPRDF